MPSWQSYLVHPFLRFYVKRRLARAASAGAARALLGHSLPGLPGASFTPDNLGGMPGEWVSGPAPPEATLLYLHGGGYFTCSALTHRAITSAFATRGFSVYAPDYRLAPEHVFPAAVDDALAVYRILIGQGPPEQLIIAGDSAGGGLALATLLAAKAENLPMPACIILFSPWTDLACTGASIVTNAARESMLYAPRINEAAENYLGGADPRTPLASPLYGDLGGLPPMLIQVSDREILLDDSTRLATNTRAAGGEVTLNIWPNLPHVWQVSQILLPEARKALDEAAMFAKSALASKAVPA
jgi:monoterpene epsilon-lactone hydrolase